MILLVSSSHFKRRQYSVHEIIKFKSHFLLFRFQTLISHNYRTRKQIINLNFLKSVNINKQQKAEKLNFEK